SGNDIPSSITLDTLGNVYVCGSGIKELTGVGTNSILVKYDADGNEVWHKEFNGTANGHDKAIKVELDSNNIYLAGFSNETGSNVDYYIMKLTESTNIQNISSSLPSGYFLE